MAVTASTGRVAGRSKGCHATAFISPRHRTSILQRHQEKPLGRNSVFTLGSLLSSTHRDIDDTGEVCAGDLRFVR